MKIHREGNKVILECEESDCNALLKTPDMAADAMLAGMELMLKHTEKALDSLAIPPELESDFNKSVDDYKERWEIIPKPTDPPAGGEDAR